MASPTLQFKRGLFVNLPALRAGEPGFTTDKYDLYLGTGAGTTASNQFYGSARYWTRENGTNAAEFKFVDKDGTSGVSLRAPATVNTPVTYTLPDGGGTTGHFLKLGSAGALEWASVTSGASFDNVSITNGTFAGVSTFSGLIDANSGLDVAGGSTFDSINVTGIGTIGTADINGGNIDGAIIGASTAAAGTFTQLNYSDSSTSGISTVGSLYVGSEAVLTTEIGGLTLSNIDEIDETTRLTLESALQLDPNDFNTLNVTGISTIGGLLDANGGLDVLGHSELDDLAVSGVSTFTGAINANGGVVGNVTGDLTGVASTATKLETARDFDITGDFITAAAVSFDGTGNVSLAATITANSIELGTYTSGDYVADVSGTANEVSVTGTGEGASVVIGLPSDVVVGTSLSAPTVKAGAVQAADGTGAITISSGTGNVAFASTVTVDGDLLVKGSTTTVNTETLLVKDSVIEIGLVDDNGSLVAPSSDANVDVGMVFHYYDTAAKKAAVYWDDSASRLAFASEVSESTGVLTASAYATILAGGLEINNACTGGTAEVISCVGAELALNNIVIDGGEFV